MDEVTVTVDYSPGMQFAIAGDIAEQLADLLHRAHSQGLVIDLQAVPQHPLAMGNFVMVGSVRQARGSKAVGEGQ